MSYELEYNARSLPPGDVARSFVPPEAHFLGLLSRSHALLVGPRGSGKTTLLKMLTVRALRNWSHPHAQEYARQITFNAAFVPADVTWGKQLEALDRWFNPARREAAFVLHTLRSLVYAMREATDLSRSAPPAHLAHLAIDLSPEQEENFVRLAADNLEVQPVLPTLLGLEIALEAKLDRISSGVEDSSFSVDSLPTKLTLLIRLFNGLIQDDDRRWALLFDELEIAPAKIKSFLISGIRSFDERIIIKLAVAPYMEDLRFEATPLSPQLLHDYHTILLTYPNKEDAAKFVLDLFDSTFRRLGIEVPSVQDLFETPQGIRVFGRQSKRTTRRRLIPLEFRSLAAKDDSFRRYIEERRIFSSKYIATENSVAQDIRKVLPIVIARDYYLRRFENGKHLGRARKSHILYTGYPSIAEITEGNPRAILTLVTPLAQQYRARILRTSRFQPIPAPLQAQAIDRIELLLTSLLQVVPLDLGGFEARKGLLDFVDQIGRAFEERLLKQPFRTDYVGTFILDENVTASVVSAVGKALNAGAIIHVPYEDSGPDSLLRGFQGQRFRLSYSLAARYRLLLTLGDKIRLSKLLVERGASVSHAQRSLFEVKGNA